MTKALEVAIQRAHKEAKTLRLCIRCNHMERACSCSKPQWVSQKAAQGLNIAELRRLPQFTHQLPSEETK